MFAKKLKYAAETKLSSKIQLTEFRKEAIKSFLNHENSFLAESRQITVYYLYAFLLVQENDRHAK